MRVVIDTETRSCLDISNTGPVRYFTDVSTEVIIVIWAIADEIQPQLWKIGEPRPATLLPLLADKTVIKAAVNSAFDRAALDWLHYHHGWPRIDPESWSDIAARAAALNLPRSLERMIPALGLPQSVEKTKGTRLIGLFCRPQKPSRKRPQGGFVTPEERPDDWRLFEDYARQDVIAAAAADRILPELSPVEHELWRVTEKINARGIAIDLPLVTAAQRLVEEHEAGLTSRFIRITGLVPGSNVKIAAWLREHGLDAPDVQASTLDDLAAFDGLKPEVAEAITIKQDIGATAVKKFSTMLDRHVNGRLHDEFRYCGASMTARWSGSGVQLQNLARPLLERDQIELFTRMLLAGEIALACRLFNRPMADLGSIVRSALIPANGSGLELQDFKSIEFRVLCWAAGEILPPTGVDIYRRTAAAIFGKPENEISGLERQIAKSAVLGSGYALSPAGFQQLMKRDLNLAIGEELAQKVIATYRRQFAAIPRLWQKLTKAFIAAHQSTRPIPIIDGRAHYRRFDDDALGVQIVLELPSGRLIRYHGVEIHPGHRDPQLVIQKVDKGRLLRMRIHAGTLTEHLVSGASRDLLGRAMILADRAGLPLVATIHDELVLDGDSQGELARIMTTTPGWAKGALIEVEGKAELRRYGK